MRSCRGQTRSFGDQVTWSENCSIFDHLVWICIWEYATKGKQMLGGAMLLREQLFQRFANTYLIIIWSSLLRVASLCVNTQCTWCGHRYLFWNPCFIRDKFHSGYYYLAFIAESGKLMLKHSHNVPEAGIDIFFETPVLLGTSFTLVAHRPALRIPRWRRRRPVIFASGSTQPWGICLVGAFSVYGMCNFLKAHQSVGWLVGSLVRSRSEIIFLSHRAPKNVCLGAPVFLMFFIAFFVILL